MWRINTKILNSCLGIFCIKAVRTGSDANLSQLQHLFEVDSHQLTHYSQKKKKKNGFNIIQWWWSCPPPLPPHFTKEEEILGTSRLCCEHERSAAPTTHTQTPSSHVSTQWFIGWCLIHGVKAQKKLPCSNQNNQVSWTVYAIIWD